jgi:hypothetical protein
LAHGEYLAPPRARADKSAIIQQHLSNELAASPLPEEQINGRKNELPILFIFYYLTAIRRESRGRGGREVFEKFHEVVFLYPYPGVSLRNV